MNKLLALAISLVFGMSMFFAFAGPATAGEDTMMQGTSCAIPSFSSPSQNSEYLGALVLDSQNNELGRVVDVTAGTDGAVNFLVVYSCLPGMSDKLVAIPVFDSELSYGQKLGTVTVSVTKDEFMGAPAITSQEWTDIGSRWNHWFNENRDYFGKNG